MNDIHAIDATKPPTANLPNDNILRVIWAYGAVLKYTNKSYLPSIEIGTREILPNGNLSYKQTFTKIPITEINIIRPMTIWRGNRKTTSFWKKFQNYSENKYFAINTKKASCISFKDIKFFKNKYNLGYIENKKFLYHFSHSTFTKLETNKNITIFIPSIELLSSTFSPKESIIKGKLFQENIDTILNHYVKEAKIKNNEYHIVMKVNKFLENEVFLAYAKFNKDTRQRLQLLRNSLEIQSDYPDRYPIILPYHPTKMDIIGDGFWLNKTTFLLFRINGYSLPDDNKIIFWNIEIDENNQKKIINKKYIRFPIEIDKEDIPIDDNENPNTRNASKHITSEIYILNKNYQNIQFKSLKSKVPHSGLNINIENKKDIDTISSAIPNQKEESNNIGKLKFYTPGENHLNQKEVLHKVIKSLKYHIYKKTNMIPSYNIYLENIMFIDHSCNLHNEYKTTTFRMIFKKDQKEISSWIIKHRIKNNNTTCYIYRKYLLVKLIFSNGKQAYLLEIERKNNEGFLGMIFNTPFALEDSIMVDILKQVVEKKGIVKNIKMDNIKKIVFKHVEKDENLHHCIQNALQKGILYGVFL